MNSWPAKFAPAPARAGVLPGPKLPPSEVATGAPASAEPGSLTALASAFDAPVPLLRPTPLHQGLPLDLAGAGSPSGILSDVARSVGGKPRPLVPAPLGYVATINSRIMAAFDAAIDE